MQKTSLDIEMKDVGPPSTMMDRTYGALVDDDIRSPRTPTYVPTFPTFSQVTAFDLSRIFGPNETSIAGAPKSTHLPPEPVKPLAWIWQCHLCRTRYPLGVTRRCLHDGHFYCSGETDRPNLKKKKRGQSCSSEFDYIGWRELGEWKRKVLGNLENGIEIKSRARGCQKCEFPSQCRYASSHTSFEDMVMTEEKGDGPSVSLMPEGSNISSLLYEKRDVPETVAFDSILASDPGEQDKKSKLRSADLQIDTKIGTESSATKTLSVKNNSAVFHRVAKSAEKRSGKRVSALSPIAEEFFCNGNLAGSSFVDMALQSWNDIVELGKGLSEIDEDCMDLT
ncbi:hypothetical protein GJ744_011613 [Endocarpon pusillum]|uniref:Uncharacterized protein n=1 Tax=Endocarpon pusillum TaxID=364733 RepID=A0A8H7E4P6_9EURO|nr:hypothetical protein GJ744_011613 [Endocarpon pusillum]